MPQFSWIVWQLVDSAFPAGGFAHSYGLEASWQQGEVDAASLPSFVRDAIAQAGHGGLPFVLAACDEPEGVAIVDDRVDAFLRNTVANRASRVQGRAWLNTVERSFPQDEVAAVVSVIRMRARCRHFAPIFGATLRALAVGRDEEARRCLYAAATGT